MANWTTLKAAIANVIKTNGNQEINGDALQNTLNSIINTVGENATFAGVATPATNPGAPDGPVFYLATEAGIYANFNGIEIAPGEAAILEWKGSWANKVTGFATQEKLTRLELQINAQKEEVDAAKEEALQAIEDIEQSAISNFNSQRVTPEMLSESTKQLIEASGGGTITNLADDEDIQSVNNGTGSNVLKFANRIYSPVNFSGKGYKIIRKNIVEGKNVLIQDMVNEPNTVYEIRYDFDLNEQEITIPEGCTLKFEGGSFSNGIINCTNTEIIGTNRCFFSTLKLCGNLNGNIVSFDWWVNEKISLDEYDIFINGNESIFGAVPTIGNINCTILTNLILTPYQRYFIEFGDGIYPFNNSVKVNKTIRIKASCKDNTLLWFPKSEGFVFSENSSSWNTEIRDISIESYLGSFVFNKCNIANWIIDRCSFISYTDHAFNNNVEFVSYGHKISNSLVYGGAGKSCFYQFTRDINCVYDNVTDQFSYFNKKNSPKYKGIVKAIFWNSGGVYCHSNIVYSGCEYVFYFDSGIAHVSCIDTVFEGVPSDDLVNPKSIIKCDDISSCSIIWEPKLINPKFETGCPVDLSGVNADVYVDIVCLRYQYTVPFWIYCPTNNTRNAGTLPVFSVSRKLYSSGTKRAVQELPYRQLKNILVHYPFSIEKLKELGISAVVVSKYSEDEFDRIYVNQPSRGIIPLPSKDNTNGIYYADADGRMLGYNLSTQKHVFATLNASEYRYIFTKEELVKYNSDSSIKTFVIAKNIDLGGETIRILKDVIFLAEVNNGTIDIYGYSKILGGKKGTANITGGYDIYTSSSVPPSTSFTEFYKKVINGHVMSIGGTKEIAHYINGDWYRADGTLFSLKYKGTSSQRPTLESANEGFEYFDTTLNKPIWWTGSKWVDSTGVDV